MSTIVTCSFRFLRRIKTSFRSTIDENRLKGSVMLSVHRQWVLKTKINSWVLDLFFVLWVLVENFQRILASCLKINIFNTYHCSFFKIVYYWSSTLKKVTLTWNPAYHVGLALSRLLGFCFKYRTRWPGYVGSGAWGWMLACQRY